MFQDDKRWTIGFLLSWFGETYTQTLFTAAVEAARQRGLNLICFEAGRVNSPFEDNHYQVLCDLATRQRLDGLVVFTEGMDQFVSPAEMHETLRCLYRDRLPLASVGAVAGLPSVSADLKSGMRELVGHLIEVHGCRRIALIHGPEAQEAALSFYKAYREALAAHDLPYDEALVTPPGVWGADLGVAAVRCLLDDRQVHFDAILGGDPEAAGVLTELRRRGIRVPFDVAVAGYNDLELARFTNPPLTTVHRPVSGSAKRAIDLLLEVVAGRPAPELNLLPTRAIIRRSCGCVPRNIRQAALEMQTLAVDPRRSSAGAPASPADLSTQLLEVQNQAAKDIRLFRLDVDPGLVIRLLEILASDAALALPQDRFLPALEGALQETLATGGDLEAWQDVLSILRKSLWPSLTADLASLARVEDLIQQGRVMLGSMIEQAEAERSARQRAAEAILRDVNRSLIASFDLSGLIDVLARELPRLGIPSCYLSLYEDPAEPAGWARLIFAYTRRGRLELEPGGLRFPGVRLVPDEIFAGQADAAVPFTWMVESLFFGDQQLGFAVFEVGPIDGFVYTTLRGQISSALRGAMLVEKNIELYNEAIRARQAAEDADRLKGRFLSTVSHELRTPLSLIVGTVEMMEARHTQMPPALYRDIESIRASAEHLSHLINDVLDLASSQAGELRLNLVPVDMTTLLEEVSILAEPLAREKGLAWRSEVPARLPPVTGDPTRLQQAALNLASNAIKFTQHGEVVLRAQVKENEIVIKVWDTGVGIPPEEQAIIFDEFRQSERTAQRGFGGMGLGLAISRRLVEMHGGRIGVISTGEEGAGSTFYFTLPLAVSQGSPPPQPEKASRKVLLLSESSPGSQQMQAMLERRGFEIETLLVSSQPGAQENWLEQVIERNPGAVILDYEPAAEFGWELMRAIKNDPNTQDTPVVFYSLSGAIQSDSAGSAILELEYLSKPLRSQELIEIIDRQGVACGTPSQRSPILVVEDDPALLELHTQMVGSLLPACRVIQAENGRAALDVMALETPALVLLDLLMPELDGFAVLEWMRLREATRATPVVVLTAQVLSAPDMLRLQKSVAAVLQKGMFTPAEVITHLEAALNRSKRLGSEAQRLVRQAMSFIHEHYAEDLSRKDLAQHVAVSERYLTRCFHEETGLTPVTYLNRYRVKMAKKLLETGELSVTEIALRVGFSDSNYFGRVFREEVGVSPGVYQRG